MSGGHYSIATDLAEDTCRWCDAPGGQITGGRYMGRTPTGHHMHSHRYRCVNRDCDKSWSVVVTSAPAPDLEDSSGL